MMRVVSFVLNAVLWILAALFVAVFSPLFVTGIFTGVAWLCFKAGWESIVTPSEPRWISLLKERN